MATAVLRIKIPKRRKKPGHGRSPQYISPSTKAMTLDFAGPTPVHAVVDLTPSSPGCTGAAGSTVCQFTYTMLPGDYTATIVTYDTTIISTAYRLSTAQGVAFKIRAGTANAINLALSGIPKSVVLAAGDAISSVNNAGGVDLFGQGAHRLLVEALDADNNVIVGAGTPSFTVGETGSLGLALSGPDSQNVLTVTPPHVYSANTASLNLTASYAGQATDGCAQPGAVCAGAVAVDTQQLLAVANYKSNVTLYGANQSAPFATLAAVGDGPMAFDADGDLFVEECGASCGGTGSGDVLVFAPPYTGAPAVVTSGIAAPEAIALDSARNLYVANDIAAGTVTEYAPPYGSGPVATISNGVSYPDAVVVDANGNVFVANEHESVREFAAGSFTSAAVVISTNVLEPNLLLLNTSGTLFVSNCGSLASVLFCGFGQQTISVYAAPLYAAAGTISNGLAGGNVLGMALDSSSNLFVSEYSGSVYEYGTASYANPAPIATITSGVTEPAGIAIDALGTVYAGNGGPSSNVAAYASPYSGAPSPTISNGVAYPRGLAILP